MPVRQFHQGYGYYGEFPSRWEFRYLPPRNGDWPDYENAIILDAPVSHTVPCSGEIWLRNVCTEEEIEAARIEMREQQIELIDACSQETRECHVSVDIPDPIADGWVQARGCNGNVCSEWGNAVVVPEPELSLALLVGVLLIGALYERTWKRRQARALPGMRVVGQRRTIRGRVREVFRSWLRLVGRGR